MRIYLAGKIGLEDWRHRIVRGLTEKLEEGVTGELPVLTSSILDLHDYTGPYFQRTEDRGMDIISMPSDVHERCYRAIDRSDVVYAWIDDPTCYATLTEIGYARARNKYIAISHPPWFDRREFWFVDHSANEVTETRRADLGLVAVLIRALRSGLVPNFGTELDRLQMNLKALQRHDPYDDEVRAARAARGQHIGHSSSRLPMNPTSVFPPERVTNKDLKTIKEEKDDDATESTD